MNPRIVAHRGWTRDHPENTLEALAAAGRLGCRAVEFDVHATADGIWVMQHDPDLRRQHGVDRVIAESTLAELRAAAPIATLAEALEAIPNGCRPMIEVKETTARHLDALATTVRSAGAHEPIVIVRGSLPSAAREALPDTPLYLFSESWDEAYARRTEPIDGYDLRHDRISPGRIADEVDRFHEAERELAVWTVNDRTLAELMLNAGVDWVITDHPEEFLELS